MSAAFFVASRSSILRPLSKMSLTCQGRCGEKSTFKDLQFRIRPPSLLFAIKGPRHLRTLLLAEHTDEGRRSLEHGIDRRTFLRDLVEALLT